MSAPPSDRPILQVEGLCKAYGGRAAVDRLSFTVAPGETVGLIGLNGAGKTTTISMILGVLTPDAGAIAIDGVDIARRRALGLSRTNFAAVYAPLPGNLTVRQNLKVFGLLYGVKDLKARMAELIETFDLARFADTKCGLLSSGEQTRVSLAKAMLNRPHLLLLDEPTASVDPASARRIRGHIRDFVRSDGGGVLWTSHNMYEVEEVCDRVLVLSQGRILLQGDPRTLPGEHGEASMDALFVKVAGDAPAEPSLVEVQA